MFSYFFGIALRLWTSTGASHYVPSYSSLSPPGCGAHRAFSSRRVRDLGLVVPGPRSTSCSVLERREYCALDACACLAFHRAGRIRR